MASNSVLSPGSRKRMRNGEIQNDSDLESEAPLAKRAISVNAQYEGSCRVPAPITTEKPAEKTRNECDYSIKISMEMAKSGKAPRPIRIYCDGIYDMFHSGHARQLMQAKTAFPGQVYLLIGVCNDELTHNMKGRTVMNETERYEAVRHCRYVDELVTNAPWTIDDAYLEHHKIDFVAHDDLPYGAGEADDIYKWLKDRDMFVATERTEGISTTDVIARIIKDYDMYVRRNLSRGYSAKELNVGFMKEKTIQFQEKIDHMKEKGHKLFDKITDKRQEIFNKWEEKSRDFVNNFVDLFGKDGRINQWLSDSKQRVSRAISPPPQSLNSASPSGSSHLSSGSLSPPRKRGRTDEDEEDDDEDSDLE